MSKPRQWWLCVGVVVLVGLSVIGWHRLTEPELLTASGETHLYCLIEVTTPLDAEQKVIIRDGLLELGRQYDLFPHRKTQVRVSLDQQKVIVELVLPEHLTKAQVVSKLAQKLPWSESTISNNSNFQVFGGLNATHEESRQAALDYLSANMSDWEESE